VNPNQIIDEAKARLASTVSHFHEELKKLRTGRAHPSQLDGVVVVAYGVPMPLNQLSNITAPEAQLLQITPFDPSNIQAIAESIRKDQNLGLNPSDDGRVVRVPIPPLTTERRQAIVKQLNEKVEDTLIVTRSVRHDALDIAKKAKLDKNISEDDLTRIEKQIDELMSKSKAEIEAAAKAKEQEIMTV
jgi:ribosome recycling factor